MAVPTEPFTYTRLAKGELRLLFPSLDEGEMTFRLETVQLQEHAATIPYDALSYTWGDLSHTSPIICNEKALFIHDNLREALPFLVRRQSPRPIWVDAICINQSDEIEKIDQVRAMHQLYRLATEVWVWLGCGTDHTAEAVSLLPRLVRVGKECKGLEPGLLNTTPESKGLPPLSSLIWDAFYGLLHHSWFCRLWIVQEAALAKSIKVLCGENEIKWADLEDAMEYAQYVNALHDADAKTSQFSLVNSQTVFLVRSIPQIVEGKDTKSPLSPQTVLARVTSLISESHRCYDPRDRVFGVLGLVDANELAGLRLDYDMTLTGLYITFCHFILTSVDGESNNLWRILRMAVSLNRMDGLPSWCPDFHRQGPENCRFSGVRDLYMHGTTENCPYKASKRPTHLRPGGSLREIVLRGRIVDTIDQVFPPMPDFETNGSIRALQSFSAIWMWEKRIAELFLGTKALDLPAEFAPSSEDGDDLQISMYWRTLVGNVNIGPFGAITYSTLCEFRRVLEVWTRVAEKVNLLSTRFPEADAINKAESQLSKQEKTLFDSFTRGSPTSIMVARLLLCQPGRQMFATSKQVLGFGIVGIEKTDVVCIFDGARAPHVLRKVDSVNDGGFRYLLVGDAYLHGFMYGEVEDLNIEEEYITLV